jgi:23S rRNA pseudouridine2605 synthase
MPERLHKLLAQHGLGSRREIEKWMLAGRVILNNKPAQPGDRYENGDRVVVDGKDVTARLLVNASTQVVAYHKPQGQPVESRNGPSQGDGVDPAVETVLERLPNVRGARWLAINTMQAGDSGLLLMTTDGRLADALRRRSESIPAAYVARVLVPDPAFDVSTIANLVRYDEQTIEFKSIEDIGGGEGTNRWFRIDSPRAHRRAAVRALFESRGLGVSRVIQVRFGNLELPRDLPRGKHRELTPAQVRELYELAGLPPPRGERGSSQHRDRHGRAAPVKHISFTGNRRPGR